MYRSSPNADAPISILEEHQAISLLFTDILMPGSMDGLKLAHAVSHRGPPIKIIIVSGKVRLLENDLPNNSRCFLQHLIKHLIAELRSFASQ